MQIQEMTKTVRFIEYDGKRFYKDGKGYWLGQEKTADGKYKRIRLHTYVWEKHNGCIPDGYEIHHIDIDTSNNDISNLVMLPREEHRALHASLLTAEQKERYRENLAKTARPAASEWHRSDAGREWHKQHYQNVTAPLWDEMVEKECAFCGKKFTAHALLESRSLYCCNSCKSRARYHSGVDNETRVCIICGKEFVTNKYSRIKTCGKECAIKLSAATKTGKPRPPRKAH